MGKDYPILLGDNLQVLDEIENPEKTFSLFLDSENFNFHARAVYEQEGKLAEGLVCVVFAGQDTKQTRDHILLARQIDVPVIIISEGGPLPLVENVLFEFKNFSLQEALEPLEYCSEKNKSLFVDNREIPKKLTYKSVFVKPMWFFPKISGKPPPVLCWWRCFLFSLFHFLM